MVHTCTFNYVTMSIPNPKRKIGDAITDESYLSLDYNKTDVDV